MVLNQAQAFNIGTISPTGNEGFPLCSSTMDACNSISVLLYRRSKPLGKVRRRVQDLRIPSSSYCDYTAGGSKLDLSHNESARLAADCLLSQGLEGYHEVLKKEGEVDFLSEPEKRYVLQNGRDANTDDAVEKDHMDKEFKNLFAECQSRLTNSDSTVECLGQKNSKDVKSSAPESDDPSAEVFLQSDSSAAGMKDLVRQFLRKAKSALAIVMDNFSDPELLCDLLEASRKRNVSVHLLLDHLNLKWFVNMWQEFSLISKSFPKVSVRSVPGQTYCAKTGRKLTGQISESFIIADWDEVLTGTYSFTWLSGQAHRSLLVLIKGSSVSHFHREFLRLYSSSKPVPGFVTFITLPQSFCLHPTSRQHPNAVGCNWKSHKAVAACPWSHGETEPQSPQGDKQPREKTDIGLHTERTAPELKSSVQTGAEYRTQSGTAGKPEHTLGAAGGQVEARAKVELLERNQNQIPGHPHPPDQTFSDVQSRLRSTTINPTAEKDVEVREPHSLNAMSLTHGQQDVHHQPGFKKQHSLAHPDGRTEGVFSPQRNRNMLTEPSGFKVGIKKERNQWDSSLNVYPKVELPCDRPKLLSPPSSQQIQSNPSHQISFRSPKEYMSKLQPYTSFREIGKQDEFMKQYQGPLDSSSHTMKSCLKPVPAGLGTSLSPQQQADSKLFQSGGRAKMHLHPVTSQQINRTQRIHWSPQRVAGPRVITRYNSFSGTPETGQAGWRVLQNSRNTSLGRSLSMTERCTAGYRGAGLHPI